MIIDMPYIVFSTLSLAVAIYIATQLRRIAVALEGTEGLG